MSDENKTEKENVLERIANSLEIANALKIQEIENNLAFTRILMWQEEEVRESIKNNLEYLNSKHNDMVNIADNIIDRLYFGLNNVDIIKNLDPIDWKVGVAYSIGMQVKHENKIYKVVQNHVSQENWQPCQAHALFTLIATEKDVKDVESGKCPDFVQPQANTTYSIDDCVVFEGKTYISKINNNAWNPSDYPQGWELQS